MEGFFLVFYIEEKQTHHGKLLWEWLLDKALKLEIRGGSAFRTIGGFGRRQRVHESSFFELAGDNGIEVEFAVSASEAEKLLALVRQEKIRLTYAQMPAHFGVIDPDAGEESGGSSGV